MIFVLQRIFFVPKTCVQFFFYYVVEISRDSIGTKKFVKCINASQSFVAKFYSQFFSRGFLFGSFACWRDGKLVNFFVVD